MASNVYCPFCGVILLPDPYWDDPGARPWYAQVRGIYSTNPAVGHIKATGVGIVRGRKTLHAPLDSNQVYGDVAPDDLDEWRLCEQSDSQWCFGFHESCWKLLILRLQHGRVESPSLTDVAIAEMVFYQLCCTPCLEGSIFHFGHDYAGAAQTHRIRGRIPPMDLGSHRYADPCVISVMDYPTDSIFAYENSMSSSEKYLMHHSSRVGGLTEVGERRYHAFSKLSTELLLEIFSYVPFGQLLTLRLVCRDLAVLADISMLPQSYWRSRFLLGQEADFVFPCLSETQDWFKLFFATRASLKAATPPLVNRKRIRDLLEPMASLVDLDSIFRHGPGGLDYFPAPMRGNDFTLVDIEAGPQLAKVLGYFSGQLAYNDEDCPLQEGCRVLYRKAQPFMFPQEKHRRRISISTVKIGARRFISGIKLFPSDEDNCVGRLIGYRDPGTETCIDVPKNLFIKAFRVAFCAEGLMGIQLQYGNSASSCWLGDSHGPGMAQGTLQIPKRPSQYHLLADLDRFKIVSLGLTESTDAHQGSLHRSPSDVKDSLRAHSQLWAPHAPMYEGLFVSLLLPPEPPRAFEPLSNMDFGGPGGMGYHYADGKSVFFGSTGGCAISIPINGPDGERISGVSIVEDNRDLVQSEGLGGLQVSTNYGRSVILAPLCYRLKASITPIPSLPLGHHITGFVAHQKTYGTQFIQLGIQSQLCDGPPTIPHIIDRECHRVPDNQIRYDEKFSHFINSTNPGNYQTYASLKGIRRIQASAGISGWSRPPNGICGLKLEYYNHPSPAIVGQWMNELKDGFDISPDEELQSVTVWITPLGFSAESPGLEVGQVAAIRFETTSARSVTFRSPHPHSLPAAGMLRNEYQRCFDEDLTAMSWIFNESSDRVRALYFETRNDNTTPERIVTVEAYFRGRSIIGLLFVYTSGLMASTGDIDTDSRQAVHIARDGDIVGMSATVAGSELVEIDFEVECNTSPKCQRLGLAFEPPYTPETTVDYGWRDVWCKDRAAVDCTTRQRGSDQVYVAPSNSRLTGIYVGCQKFSNVGAIYEPVISQ
ncbi:Peroxidase, 2 family protein [Aspergillus niger]|uniref:Peroxidase, 2 family protein n=1 Tax=Aspergillus niger TaxID=5061 RepID=A0A505HVQ4_ASPNG|nr:Peroxidase, 2 family protein [Aspergillus niger]